MKLSKRLRDELKTPFGKLILEKNTNKETIQKEIPTNSFLITVGDATTEKMLNLGLVPSLQIVDSQEKRKPRAPPNATGTKTQLFCNNPAGEITVQSIKTIKTAFQSTPPIRISVNGEEDLLTIPVCIYAPDNATVLYGQPNKGLVVVVINTEIKNKAKSVLESMN